MGKKRQNGFLWLLFGGGVFLLLAGLVSVLLNRQPQPDVTSTPATLAQVRRVSLQDARDAFDEGTAVFLDVRIGESYAASHILNAVSIPAAELPSRMGELDPGAWIIPY
jgi:hypothetical protein